LKKLRIIQNRFLVKKIIETNFQNFKLKKIWNFEIFRKFPRDTNIHAFLQLLLDLSEKVELSTVDERVGVCVSCDKKPFRSIPGVHQVFGDVTELGFENDTNDALADFFYYFWIFNKNNF